jgi:hypothetical protein
MVAHSDRGPETAFGEMATPPTPGKPKRNTMRLGGRNRLPESKSAWRCPRFDTLDCAADCLPSEGTG